MILTALFTTLLIIGSYIKIPIGSTPFTLQLFIVCLSVILLGVTKTSTCVLVYLLLGLIGLPVFTSGGGLTSLASPTFGFVLGFILFAVVFGSLSKKLKHGFIGLLLSSIVGLITLYTVGFVYAYFIMRFYIGSSLSVWEIAFSFIIIFIPFDAIKCITACYLGNKLSPIINRNF